MILLQANVSTANWCENLSHRSLEADKAWEATDTTEQIKPLIFKLPLQKNNPSCNLKSQ